MSDSLQPPQEPRSRLSSFTKWISNYRPKSNYGQLERVDSSDQIAEQTGIPTGTTPGPLNELQIALRGPGINFFVKYMGSEETAESKGKQIVSEAMDQLNMGLKNKKRFIMNISIVGIKLVDPDTKELVELHAIHRISQCAHDVSPDRIRLISYVAYNQGSDRYFCHMFKYEESAQIIHETIGRAFEEAFKVHKEKEAEKANASSASPQTQYRERVPSASRPLAQVDEFSEFQAAPSQGGLAPAPTEPPRSRVQSFNQQPQPLAAPPAGNTSERRQSFVQQQGGVALPPPPSANPAVNARRMSFQSQSQNSLTGGAPNPFAQPAAPAPTASFNPFEQSAPNPFVAPAAAVPVAAAPNPFAAPAPVPGAAMTAQQQQYIQQQQFQAQQMANFQNFQAQQQAARANGDLINF